MTGDMQFVLAQNIKCTLREIRCFKKTLEATTRVMAPLSAAERSQVGRACALLRWLVMGECIMFVLLKAAATQLCTLL